MRGNIKTTQKKRANGKIDSYTSSDYLMRGAPAPPQMEALSGGMAKGPVTNPGRALPGATENNPNSSSQKSSNAGFQRFLAVDRGSRGGRTLSGMDNKSGAVYTKGKQKGMTQGEGDVQAHQTFQGMGDEARDNYRPENSEAMATSRQNEIGAARDEFALARQFQSQIRGDIAAENAAKGPVTNAGEFTPKPTGESEMISAPSAIKPVANKVPKKKKNNA
jgi:hypothetical protein